VHHLSSVAAVIPAPRRTIYAATKAAGLMAFETCRVECEGLGVRFLSLLPGTIDNGFRLKTATSQSGGTCEVHEGVTAYENLLLPPGKGERPACPSPRIHADEKWWKPCCIISRSTPALRL
jgi:NAD(P)-dependent dehydrogenase (short-subunit alcohol dehydrogenase family)